MANEEEGMDWYHDWGVHERDNDCSFWIICWWFTYIGIDISSFLIYARAGNWNVCIESLMRKF